MQFIVLEQDTIQYQNEETDLVNVPWKLEDDQLDCEYLWMCVCDLQVEVETDGLGVDSHECEVRDLLKDVAKGGMCLTQQWGLEQM